VSPRPHSEVMIASNLSDIRGRLTILLQMLDLNAAVGRPTAREKERSDRVLEALFALRGANALTKVSLNG
jgi:hypothetical protein